MIQSFEPLLILISNPQIETVNLRIYKIAILAWSIGNFQNALQLESVVDTFEPYIRVPCVRQEPFREGVDAVIGAGLVYVFVDHFIPSGAPNTLSSCCLTCARPVS